MNPLGCSFSKLKKQIASGLSTFYINAYLINFNLFSINKSKRTLNTGKSIKREASIHHSSIRQIRTQAPINKITQIIECSEILNNRKIYLAHARP